MQKVRMNYEGRNSEAMIGCAITNILLYINTQNLWNVDHLDFIIVYSPTSWAYCWDKCTCSSTFIYNIIMRYTYVEENKKFIAEVSRPASFVAWIFYRFSKKIVRQNCSNVNHCGRLKPCLKSCLAVDYANVRMR